VFVSLQNPYFAFLQLSCMSVRCSVVCDLYMLASYRCLLSSAIQFLALHVIGVIKFLR
jgi:hypothetical protein